MLILFLGLACSCSWSLSKLGFFFWKKTRTLGVQNTSSSFEAVLSPCWLSRMGRAIGIAPCRMGESGVFGLKVGKKCHPILVLILMLKDDIKAARQGGMPTEEEESSSALLCDWDWLCCCWVEQCNAAAAPAPTLWCFCSRLCWLTSKKIWYTEHNAL